MPALLIKDFLQTQGLKLPQDNVLAAYLAAQTVINLGNASVERSILWPKNEQFDLTEYFSQTAENEVVLKQIFMAADSVYSRSQGVKSATVYVQMPSENQAQLISLNQQGSPLECCLAVAEENSQTYLACRTAQSGWMNIADDTAYWLGLGELKGERNTHSGAQISIPVCTKNGSVLGVVHVEFAEKGQATDEALTDWAALALALAVPFKTLLGIEDGDEGNE